MSLRRTVGLVYIGKGVALAIVLGWWLVSHAYGATTMSSSTCCYPVACSPHEAPCIVESIIYVIMTWDAQGNALGTITDFDTLRDCISVASSFVPLEEKAACYRGKRSSASYRAIPIGPALWSRPGRKDVMGNH